MSREKHLNKGSAPIGDDIAPNAVPREDVEVTSGEEEEPFEAEVRRARGKPKSPSSREKQVHKDSVHAVYRSWCLSRKLCGTGGLHRIELLDEEERENETSIVAFNHGFLTQDNADTFPLVICRKKRRYGQTGATCCERKKRTAYSISFLVPFIKDLGYCRIILKCDSGPSMKSLQDA